MKRFLVLLGLLAILLFSCSKDKQEENNYYFRCTVDDVQKRFDVDAFGVLSTDGGEELLMISAAENNGNDSPIIGFSISNHPGGKPVTARVYTDEYSEFQTEAAYSPNGAAIYKAGATLKGVSEAVNIPIANHLRFEIKSITNGTISGTFSGDFHLDAEPDEARKVIANGEFFIPLLSNP